MYFSKSLAFVALAVFGVKACKPGTFSCTYRLIGTRLDLNTPSSAIWICNSQSELELSADCGGENCCQKIGNGHYCVC